MLRLVSRPAGRADMALLGWASKRHGRRPGPWLTTRQLSLPAATGAPEASAVERARREELVESALAVLYNLAIDPQTNGMLRVHATNCALDIIEGSPAQKSG